MTNTELQISLLHANPPGIIEETPLELIEQTLKDAQTPEMVREYWQEANANLRSALMHRDNAIWKFLTDDSVTLKARRRLAYILYVPMLSQISIANPEGRKATPKSALDWALVALQKQNNNREQWKHTAERLIEFASFQ